MQELLDELNDANSGNNFIQTTINLIIDMVESKLEKEKEQIIEAVQHGLWNNEVVDMAYYSKIYYENTFKRDVE